MKTVIRQAKRESVGKCATARTYKNNKVILGTVRAGCLPEIQASCSGHQGKAELMEDEVMAEMFKEFSALVFILEDVRDILIPETLLLGGKSVEIT